MRTLSWRTMPAEAVRLWRETDHSDEFTLENYPDPEVEQWDDARMFTVHFDDAPRRGTKQRQTCGEWALENGPGFLASTEF